MVKKILITSLFILFCLVVINPAQAVIVFNSSNIDYSALPEKFDLREKGWITPPKNQLDCGSCAAFSSVGLVESVVKRELNDSNFNIDLSEQYLLSCSKAVTCNFGGLESSALMFMSDIGLAEETSFKYVGNDSVHPICNDTNTKLLKVKDVYFISDDFDAIKHALVNYGPVTAILYVYEDLENYYFGGVYEYEWGNFLFSNSVIIVGYNDVENYWIVKNSWGDDWGEDGFFKINYSQTEFNLSRDFHEQNVFYINRAYFISGTDITDEPVIGNVSISDKNLSFDQNVNISISVFPKSIKNLSSVTVNGRYINGDLYDGGTFNLSTTPKELGCTINNAKCDLEFIAIDNLNFSASYNDIIFLNVDNYHSDLFENLFYYFSRFPFFI